MAGKYFGIPFALSGDRAAIPDAAQPDGSVSFTQGFTLDYELENTDPNYKPVPREETNALYYEITEAIGIVQKQGFADWTIAASPYPINAFVRHNDIVWRNTVAANSVEPGTDSTWVDASVSVPSSLLTSGIAGSFSNLKASATGLSALVTATADSLCLKNSANEQVVLNAVSVTPSLAASGANGLDTGASVASTWYSVWVIWNGTTVAGLLSLSSTSPTMPLGYTHKARVGWVRTDGSANKYPLSFIQAGRRVRYKVATGSNVAALPVLGAGNSGGYTAGSTAWAAPTAISVLNFVPATAAAIEIALNTNGTFSSVAAPNAQYAGDGSAVNPPPVIVRNAGAQINSQQAVLALESSNIYWGSDGASNRILCVGWEDSL